MSHVLRVGDSVIVRPDYGREQPIKVIVDALHIHGQEFDEVTWELINQDSVILIYTNPDGKGKWAYSNQLSPV